MNGNLALLAERRERLIAQAAAQRKALAEGIEPWRAPLAMADQGLALLRFVMRHRAWIAGGAILFAATRPARAGKWLGMGLTAWKMLLRLRGS